jgi:prepilin-type N-terminal cleavage/methylation domain-containing protein
MNLRNDSRRPRPRGFTLLELLLVILILGLVIGAVFTQMSDAQQRMTAEETRLDDFQQARDFVDQFFRDINQIGDPNFRLMDTTSTFWNPALTKQTTYTYASAYINDNRFAIGLVKIDSNELRFEGAVNGAAQYRASST